MYNADLRKRYLLDNPDWKYDVMPEIWDGHNIMDFVDPDIDARLEELEREEEHMAAAFEVCLFKQIATNHVSTNWSTTAKTYNNAGRVWSYNGRGPSHQ